MSKPIYSSTECSLSIKGTLCPGRVFVVEPLAPIQDTPGRLGGYSVCDTCQTRYDVTTDEDGGNITVLVTTGRARGLPPEDQEYTDYGTWPI
jgi:hypothetical protein